jgi:prepilin-type processing-associated H-X9-DG protein
MNTPRRAAGEGLLADLSGKRANSNQAREGFTRTELAALTGMLTLLAFLSLPMLAGQGGKSRAFQCLNNMRQIGLGATLFTQDNNYFPPLYRMYMASGWPGYLYNSNTFTVKNGSVLFWEDALLQDGYLKDPAAVSCPALTPPFGKSAHGIGINYPEIGIVITSSGAPPMAPSAIAKPSSTVAFADAGSVTAATRNLDADSWVPDIAADSALYSMYGSGPTYFMSPSDSNFAIGDRRVIARHESRAVTGWVDGHASLMRNSLIGWQYPRTDARALWSRSH